MMNRVGGSVRLRSKMDQDGVDGKRRRAPTNNNNNSYNSSFNSGSNNNNGQVSVNGNGGGGGGSRSGGPRTRGMDPDDVNISNISIPGGESSMEVSEDRDNVNAVESSPSSSSNSSDSSDSEDSSEMDEGTCETKRVEYQDELNDLEKQFMYMREMLYKERLKHVEEKIEEVRSGKAREYLNPLEELQENMRIRIDVAGKLRSCRMVNLQNKYEAEELASFQNFESEKALLRDEIKTDLEEKINRLEEDRNNDFTSELWLLETALKRKNKKTIDIFGEKRKKPTTVSGPYIVYMLNDVDIVEDWTIIKKAMAAPKRKYLEII